MPRFCTLVTNVADAGALNPIHPVSKQDEQEKPDREAHAQHQRIHHAFGGAAVMHHEIKRTAHAGDNQGKDDSNENGHSRHVVKVS